MSTDPEVPKSPPEAGPFRVRTPSLGPLRVKGLLGADLDARADCRARGGLAADEGAPVLESQLPHKIVNLLFAFTN